MSAVLRVAGLMVMGLIVASAGPGAAGQVTTPSGGMTHTVAVEGTIESVSPDSKSLSVRTTDGTTQLFGWLDKVFVHGGKPDADDELSSLHRGMSVVVHYSGTGKDARVQEIDRVDGDGLKTTEGRVVAINRSKDEITVRLADNTTEKLKLTNRVSGNVGRDLDKPNTPVVVYYTDNKGVKEVHYFKKK